MANSGTSGLDDRRRNVPGTDTVLNQPPMPDAAARIGRTRVTEAIRLAQQRARNGEIEPEHVADNAAAALPRSAATLAPVVNATGVLLHTNLGRAPLSDAAVHAIVQATGTTDVELDLDTGERGRRGAPTVAALLEAVPAAEAAHVVNNGAAALALAATALAQDREIVIARGEMVEIGDGFRIPDLLASTGARLREVGTTNRVHIDDYRAALGAHTGFMLKVHPSNFRVTGFTSSVSTRELSRLGRDFDVPVVADIGSGLLGPHPRLPSEPDAQTTLVDGTDLVTASGDKLLGGPQAGLLLGRRATVDSVRRHPLARAMRVDKLTLAALEATVRGPTTPTARALSQHQDGLVRRANELAQALCASGIPADVSATSATVGGGGAPGVELASAAVLLPQRLAAPLRHATPPVVTYVSGGHCVLDLFAVGPAADEAVLHAVRTVGS